MDNGLVREFYDTTGGEDVLQGYNYWNSLQTEIADFIKEIVGEENFRKLIGTHRLEVVVRSLTSKYNEEIISDDEFSEIRLEDRPIATFYSSRNDYNYVSMIVSRASYQDIKELLSNLCK